MTREPLERALEPAIDEARIASTWQRIREARGAVRPRGRRWPLALALASAAAAIALYAAWPAARPGPLTSDSVALAAGAVLDAPGGRAIELDDRSRLELAGGARLAVLTNEADRFVTQLQRGRARFDVHPGGPRRWEIETALATVEVVGTAFSVEASDQRVAIEVERGVVVVRGEHVPGRVVRLTAGEHLAIESRVQTAGASGPSPPRVAGDPQPSAPEVGAASPPLPPPSASNAAIGSSPSPSRVGSESPRAPSPSSSRVESGSSRAPSPSSSRVDSGSPRSPSPSSSRVADGSQPAPAANRADPDRAPPARDGAAAQHATAHDVTADPPHARTIGQALDTADQRRAAGDPAGAAAELERALGSARRDEAAGLAAFTLGRIYLEDLRAPDRAASAFEQMIAIGVPFGLLEDAHARRIEALVRARRGDAAAAALAEYDRLYPRGAHHAAVHALFTR